MHLRNSIITSKKLLAILIITIGVILSGCGFSTSSEPEIVAQQTLLPHSTDTPVPQPTDTPTPQPTANDDAVSLPQETEEPADTNTDTEQSTSDTQPTDVPDESADSADSLQTGESADIDLDAIPDTVAVNGQITNGTAGAVPPENLAVEVVSIELSADRQPVGVFESQEVTTTGTTFHVDSLQIAPNAAILARTDYGGVQYVSDPILGTEVNDPEVNLALTVYESTTDSSAVTIGQAWYIVGTSPDENLTEVLMWYFVRNDSDRVIYSAEGQGGVSFDLPQGAFGVRFDNDPADRYIVDDSGDATLITDTEPLKPGQDGLITVTYLLPYDNAEVTLTDHVDYNMEAVTVYVARIFELEFDGQNFTSGGVREIQTLGDYDSYTLQGGLQAGDTLAFTVSGDTPRPGSDLPASSTTGQTASTEPEESFLERNATLVLGLGVLLVIAGFAYLFLDLQRQRLLVQAQLAGRGRYDDLEDDRDDLLDAIADLDERFEAGEIDEEEYEAKRDLLKRRLRRLM